jgi:hypothetical protein
VRAHAVLEVRAAAEKNNQALHRPLPVIDHIDDLRITNPAARVLGSLIVVRYLRQRRNAWRMDAYPGNGLDKRYSSALPPPLLPNGNMALQRALRAETRHFIFSIRPKERCCPLSKASTATAVSPFG